MSCCLASPYGLKLFCGVCNNVRTETEGANTVETKNVQNGQKIAVAAISLILCAALFYFFYYTKTPVYSMKLIGEAVQKHDLETFERHVDVKHMVSKVFDDFVAKESKDKNGSIAGDAFALGLVNALKPVAVAELQDAVYAEVAKKDEPTQQKKSKINVLDRFKSNSKAASFKDISTVSKNGDTAIVGVKYHNRKVDKDYTLNVKMEKLNDGKWRAKELTNLLELLDQTEKDEEEKLKELDKPFKEEIWKNVDLGEDYGYRIIQRGAGVNINFTLEVCVPIRNISQKEIASVNGFLQIENKKAPNVGIKRFRMGTHTDIAPGKESVKYSFLHLDLSDQAERSVISMDRDNELFIRCFVMSIKFTDGTKIERPTKLPEPT